VLVKRGVVDVAKRGVTCALCTVKGNAMEMHKAGERWWGGGMVTYVEQKLCSVWALGSLIA
jgi:hypothetical protein